MVVLHRLPASKRKPLPAPHWLTLRGAAAADRRWILLTQGNPEHVSKRREIRSSLHVTACGARGHPQRTPSMWTLRPPQGPQRRSRQVVRRRASPRTGPPFAKENLSLKPVREHGRADGARSPPRSPADSGRRRHHHRLPVLAPERDKGAIVREGSKSLPPA